jgi:hypothetical protein
MINSFEKNIGPSGEKIQDRIQLLYINDEYTNLTPGDQGVVNFIDDYRTIHIDWDNGSSLGLLPDCDEWRIL